MNKPILIFALLFSAIITLPAQEPKATIEPGKYLLVYQFKDSAWMNPIEITFEQKADGKLYGASLGVMLPSLVYQSDPVFQFSMIKQPESLTKKDVEVLSFLGRTDINVAHGQPVCASGTMSRLYSNSTLGQEPVFAQTGNFLLYKLPQ